jgi:hypothetical protein
MFDTHTHTQNRLIQQWPFICADFHRGNKKFHERGMMLKGFKKRKRNAIRNPVNMKLNNEGIFLTLESLEIFKASISQKGRGSFIESISMFFSFWDSK